MTPVSDFGALRRRMVERQIQARGVCSPRVLDAMSRVRREGYVPSYLGEFAYEDTPLPIEEEQTISQPYIVAFMLDALGLEGGRARARDRDRPEAAPFDAIVVAAGGPAVPGALREQLAVGGRLVIPVGEEVGLQKLIRVTRVGAERYREEELADVRFVPLIGREGWCARAPSPSTRWTPWTSTRS